MGAEAYLQSGFICGCQRFRASSEYQKLPFKHAVMRHQNLEGQNIV